MARIPALVVIAGAGLLAAGAAPAAAETQSFSVNGTGSVSDVLSDTLSFDKFDTSLGTLTGVVFDLSSDPSQSVTFSLSGGEGGNGAGETSVNFLASGPGNGGPITLFSGTGTAAAGCSDSSSGDLCTATDQTVSNATFTTPATVNGALDLPSYEGPGTFNVDVNLDSLLIHTTSCAPSGFPAPTCTTTGSAAWSGDITVTFQFDAPTNVPEPGTFGLFAAALGGLAMLARRRRVHRF
jgi:hypothetical protein